MTNHVRKFNEDITDENPWKVFPGSFGDSKDNIHIVPKFIEENDIVRLQEFVKKIDKWDNAKESEAHSKDGASKYNADLWYNRLFSHLMIKDLDQDIYNLIDNYLDKMKLFMDQKFNCKVKKRPPSIVCWRPGDFQIAHADKQIQDGRPNSFPDYDINSLFYINNEFTGGELFYTQHRIKIKPAAGMAVCHPGDINYIHGVTPILSGIRWVIPAFFSVEEF